MTIGLDNLIGSGLLAVGGATLLIVIFGVVAFLSGIIDTFLSGITLLNVFLIVLGVITCFSCYKSYKLRKVYITFFAELNS